MEGCASREVRDGRAPRDLKDRRPRDSRVPLSFGSLWSLVRAAAASHKPQIRLREAADVGKGSAEIGGADAEPAREGGAVFVDAGGGDPGALRGVVGTADRERGHGAVNVAAVDGTAHDDVVRAPAVIGAVAV